MSDDAIADIAVIGGGPGGLTAALKSALLAHSCVVVDKGKRTSRAFFVPNMANVPGYPTGVSGKRLMDDLRAQIAHVESVAGRDFVRFEDGTAVTGLKRVADHYELTGHRVVGRNGVGDAVTVRARTVVLATGVVDRQPYIGDDSYSIKAILPYANKGIADYCLLCDGHTVRGKRVAVLGVDRSAAGIAATLRDHFGAAEAVLVSCVPCVTGTGHHDHAEHEAEMDALVKRGLPVIDHHIARLDGLKDDRIRLTLDDGSTEDFDKAWVSFGWFKLNNELAVQAGAALDAEGYVTSTEDCEVLDADGAAIPGLFVVGDLRAETWNQIPVAMGDAETAVITAYAVRL